MPWGVDVATGVEVEGEGNRKDRQRIELTIEPGHDILILDEDLIGPPFKRIDAGKLGLAFGGLVERQLQPRAALGEEIVRQRVVEPLRADDDGWCRTPAWPVESIAV